MPYETSLTAFDAGSKAIADVQKRPVETERAIEVAKTETEATKLQRTMLPLSYQAETQKLQATMGALASSAHMQEDVRKAAPDLVKLPPADQARRMAEIALKNNDLTSYKTMLDLGEKAQENMSKQQERELKHVDETLDRTRALISGGTDKLSVYDQMVRAATDVPKGAQALYQQALQELAQTPPEQFSAWKTKWGGMEGPLSQTKGAIAAKTEQDKRITAEAQAKRADAAMIAAITAGTRSEARERSAEKKDAQADENLLQRYTVQMNRLLNKKRDDKDLVQAKKDLTKVTIDPPWFGAEKAKKEAVDRVKELEADYEEQLRDIREALPTRLQSRVQQFTTPKPVVEDKPQSKPTTLSPEDQQAKAWAEANPKDPRAQKIKQRLGL